MVRQGAHQIELVIEQLLCVGATVQLCRQTVVGVESTTSNIQPDLAHCNQHRWIESWTCVMVKLSKETELVTQTINSGTLPNMSYR